MPESSDECDINNENYYQIKSLRLNESHKRLRHLRAFERIYYKKTCEVQKSGHNLEDVHRLHDGNLRYVTQNLKYSLNKKKRWLLPNIIAERITEYNPKLENSIEKRNNEISTVDERLKIVMYENENIRQASTCFRYGNSQTEPRILYKNGRRFNSETLTKWIDFNTRTRWNRRNRRNIVDDVNQPNFGFQERPGFFPSEVTYEFLYPKRLSSADRNRQARTSIMYFKELNSYDQPKRAKRDTNKHRRIEQRIELTKLKDSVDEDDLIEDESETIDANCEQCDDHISKSSNQFPINCFILQNQLIPKSRIHSNSSCASKVDDRKSRKYFESQTIVDESSQNSPAITEEVLCTLNYENERDFIILMQEIDMNISQANLSPAIFVQRALKSTFAVVYSYSRTSLTVNVTIKYADKSSKIKLTTKQVDLKEIITFMSNELEKNQIEYMKTIMNPCLKAHDLRGSILLPLNIAEQFILVRPNSIDKYVALNIEKIEHPHNNNTKVQIDQQGLSTTNDDFQLFECLICFEGLSKNDVYEIFPCHHTLCYSCLNSYIRTNISSATYSSTSNTLLNCFQSNCSTQLNTSLIQAFISFDIYETYIETLIDRRLFSTGNYRKCPSRGCSKLLVVEDQNKPSLMCLCGQRVCSKCLEEYHFPATCQQYKSYFARLRESSDDLLCTPRMVDVQNCYIAEGKNCPNCGEFVEKNGGCPHMTCRCGNQYCWVCLKRWATHRSTACSAISESKYELRSSIRNRLHNKAVNHRRQRNQYSFDLLSAIIRHSPKISKYATIILATYIDMNTLAEFIYVILQRRRTDVNIRAALGQTAKCLEADASRIKTQCESNTLNITYIEQVRSRIRRTLVNLIYMKNNRILI